MPAQHTITTLSVRFNRKVGPADENGCRLWLGQRMPHGYGLTTINKRRWLAHRVAWMLANGEIGPGLCILHRCDNPPCVAIEHLFIGTPADNTADMIAKGRQRTPTCYRGDEHWSKVKPELIIRGTHHGMAKLTEDQVREIRRRYENGEANQYELAREYSVSRPMIGNIIRRENWKHLL